MGEMDELSRVDWAQTPYSVVGSDKHDSLSLDMARKSMTLLQNKNGILPLKRGGKVIAVMGPNANDSVMQWGNYNGTPKRTITILDGIRSAMGKDDKLIYEQGCSWVERKLIRSVFSQCKSENGPGFSARYWNNTEFKGEPAATAQLSTPFHLCTSGATVFAPGVNLTDFSAVYQSVFTPRESGDVVFDFYCYGSVKLLVDGKEVKSFTNKHGSRPQAHGMRVEAGKSYDIEIRFQYFASDAQLNFDIGFKEECDIQRSVAKVKDADIVIFAGGISPQLEGEEMGVDLPGFKRGDRTDIELPAVQREMIKALHDAGKKVIFVNCSGSPLPWKPRRNTAKPFCRHGIRDSRAVRLLPKSCSATTTLPDACRLRSTAACRNCPTFEDYNMAGHTYRFFKGEPLFPFGYGLSYTTFKYGKMKLDSSVKVGETAKITVPITNTGSRDGEEVVQVYLKKSGETDGPIKTLRAFKRVRIPAGKTVKVELALTPKQLEWWDNTTNTMRTMQNTFDVLVGGSSQEKDLQKKTLKLL